MDKWFTDTIAEIKGKLQNPALTNATRREILKSDLTRYERKLIEHQEFEQAGRRVRDAMYAEGEKIRLLAPTQDMHSFLQSLKESHARTVADMARNAQLWSNYNRAKQINDAELVVKTERELADYLTAQIGRIDHTQYPTAMTLSQVMKLYEKHSSKTTVFGLVSKRFVVLFGLAAVLSLPPAILLFNSRRRARAKGP